ncbi:energy-coupling factor transporter ATPase [Mycoplasmopsis ciconiae]|uniref:Energy-coupling factor transporter ATP-binding protein EcfA2 n=1 Tax=Mycoplasmopsis ciconiae TaxID=561067 RepID=A0ABU7MNL6_9BACT|nr:energy-coupling factor transporter ATPase [Mycoplasmopsis ciconiae]
MQIEVKKIAKIFNKKTPMEFVALKNASATIKQGEYVGIIGQTGSGKTTFIEHLNALLTPDDGNVEWIFEGVNKKNQKEIFNVVVDKKTKPRHIKKAKNIRKRIGVVFQFAEYQLFKKTIEEDIMFGPLSFNVPKNEAKEIAKEVIKQVGLDESFLDRSPFDLSGGQKRRVAIAGILAMKPDFLVVDEPTAGLDPVGVKEILDIFDHLHKQGKTIVNVSHDLDNILKHSQRTIVFKKGEIVRDGDTYEILRDTNFLLENQLQPPKLFTFMDKLEQKGFKPFPRITNLEQLCDYLNKYKHEEGE